MKTYFKALVIDKEVKTFLYFYDPSIRFWTMYEIDGDGNQISREADHFHNKKQLLLAYPELDFRRFNEVT